MPRAFLIKIVSTFFYSGYFPFIPGTFASLTAIALIYLAKDNIYLYFLITSLLLILGFLVSGEAEKLFQRKDSPCIVIDEVSGMLIAFSFIPFSAKSVTTAFFLFRVLDILKPYPANYLQRLKGSFGVMSDDIIAGLYTNIILQLIF